MRKFIMIMLLTAFTGSVLAQTTAAGDRRIIQVSGEAEREVSPDIIYLSISLKEYFRDNNQRRKVTIDVLEKQLYDAAMKIGVKPEDFTINNISSYNYDWNRKKNDPGFLAAKQYRIKVANLNGINTLFAAVDPQGVQYSNVDGYDYSGKKELERELKIQAIRDAKFRAEYLAEAVGDRVGKALSISESGHVNYPQNVYKQYSRVAMAESVAMDAAMPEIDVKKIKFTYTIGVVFELQ